MAKSLESDESEASTFDPETFFISSKVPTYKVILLGETGSGKTSLFLRYKYGTFQRGPTLNCADRYQKEFVVDDGEKVKVCKSLNNNVLQVWEYFGDDCLKLSRVIQYETK